MRSAEKTPTVEIQVIDMFFVNKNAANNLTVKYGNSILDITGDDEVYTQTDALEASPEHAIPVEWIHLRRGLHRVVANWDNSGIVASGIIAVVGMLAVRRIVYAK